MQILDIDAGGIETITNEIINIVITGNVLQINYKNGNVTYWRLLE